MDEYEYTLTMNSGQARTMLNAVELLMRLKLNQPEQFFWALYNTVEKHTPHEFCSKRDMAKPLIEVALKIMFKDFKDSEWKDDEWYRLYNLYQATRYALHEAENPEGKGVDSYPPMRLTDEPMPKCEWKRVNGECDGDSCPIPGV